MHRLPCVWVEEKLECLKTVHKFWESVKEVESGCWEWQGDKDSKGYGRTRIFGKRMKTHRVAWKLTRFFIQTHAHVEKCCVLHKCDNPLCCRPSHLFLGSLLDNVVDMCAKGRQARGSNSGAAMHPERVARGERCHSAKLSESKVVEILNMINNGATQQKVASIYGVTQVAISKLVLRKTWKHVIVPIELATI